MKTRRKRMNETKIDNAEIEAVVRAEAERLGYRPGEFLDDHMAIALAALGGVRDARGDDEAELREKIADELAENDQCGVGPLSRQEYLDDAEAILSLIRTYGGTQAARSPRDDDGEAPTTYQDALAAACGTEADGPARSSQGEDDRVLVNDEKTVLVNVWSTGEVEVAFRADPGAMWGPPIRVVEDA